jgi:hypothetical protein
MPSVARGLEDRLMDAAMSLPFISPLSPPYLQFGLD